MLRKLQISCTIAGVEVEAMIFVPKIGHLGQREPVVQPATERKRNKATCLSQLTLTEESRLRKK
jgi:hypothetical protein